MNIEVKRNWLNALESGEYTKTEGALKTESGAYCCLGVLCDLYIKETGVGFWKAKENSHIIEFCNPLEKTFEEALLPQEVVEWAGLDSSDPYVEDENFELDSLSELNDNTDTFEEVIQVIREQM